MNVRWMIPAVALVFSLASVADAQTAAAPATSARPAAGTATAAAARPSVGEAAVAAPVAASAGFAEIGQAPPAPPSPPAPAPAPQAPMAPSAPRAPRATTGEAPPAAPPEAPRVRGQLINLRLEFTVTDQIGTAAPVKKVITMNVADGESGRIRTSAAVFRKNAGGSVVPLSVDAFPQIEGGKIRLRASLDYQLLNTPTDPDLPPGTTSITQSVTSILSDGVLTMLSQSADPLTDRKVTLEVKATIVR